MEMTIFLLSGRNMEFKLVQTSLVETLWYNNTVIGPQTCNTYRKEHFIGDVGGPYVMIRLAHHYLFLNIIYLYI